jgi:hypothetical protein
MGSEMSCPCGTRPPIKEESKANDNDIDIIERLQRSRLSEDDLLFSKINSNPSMYSFRSSSMFIRKRTTGLILQQQKVLQI